MIDDLVAAVEGLVLDGLPEGPDVVDPPVRGPVDLEDVDRAVLVDLRQKSHSLQGVGVGPCSQLRALARIRAAVVLPTPRMPEKR